MISCCCAVWSKTAIVFDSSSGRLENKLAYKTTSKSVKIGPKTHRTLYTPQAQQRITFREPRAASHAIRGEGAAESKH